MRNTNSQTKTAADIKEAFAFKHAISCDYVSLESQWKDSLGNQRVGKEPDRRRCIRHKLQATRDPIEHKHFLAELNEFDKGWKR